MLFCIIHHIVYVAECGETVYSKQETNFGPMEAKKLSKCVENRNVSYFTQITMFAWALKVFVWM